MRVSSILHVLDGRVRVKLSDVKGAPARAREVEARLFALEGIDQVEANPTTGSVLILHDSGRVAAPEIVDQLRGWGYFRDPEPVAQVAGGLGDGLGSLFLRATTEAALQTLLTALI